MDHCTTGLGNLLDNTGIGKSRIPRLGKGREEGVSGAPLPPPARREYLLQNYRVTKGFGVGGGKAPVVKSDWASLVH